MKKPFVYICLSIDTEGPLYEDIVATFQRLESILEVKIPLKPSKRISKSFVQEKSISLPQSR